MFCCGRGRLRQGCFVIAAAQTGVHPGSGRKTFGHSLIVGPWGEVILDAGPEIGLHFATLDLGEVGQGACACGIFAARSPSLV